MLKLVVLTLVVFSLCFLAIGIGLLIKGITVQGSCGASSDLHDESDGCGGCAKKERELCPSDDETGLLDMAQMGNPQRTLKDGHKQTPLEV